MDVDPLRRAFERQYDNPNRVEIGTDTACIYDIAPPHPRSSVPILFCPGWMENPQNHKETIYALYRQGRRTVFPDSPHGIEARPRANLPMAQLRHAEVLIATLKHQGIDEADAIAHSAGAIGLAIAGTASGGPRFRNVVLQSPAGLCGGETVASVAWHAWQESRQETRRQRWKPTEHQLIRDPGRRRMYWVSTLARTVAEINAIANVDIRELLIEMRRRGGLLAVVHGTDDRLFSMGRMQRHVDVGVVDGFYSVEGGHQQILLEPSQYASLASEALLALERRRHGSGALLHDAAASVQNV
jgi:pimeloyl-ACP methyl ester carboxylesterase